MPRTSLHAVYSTNRESLEDLASGRVHFALVFSAETKLQAARLASLECFMDEYVVPRASTHYLAERQIIITPWNI
ncbi:DNA-binding transcriptional LysR family regulator [Paraburkholderia sp. WSM4179]|nr:DNA-binding transcriptional LysR family regulator [Paraburkholderia sp. WSM4179]